MDSKIVHRQNREIEYRSSSYSFAYFIHIIITTITILLPIPIIFASRGLWKKQGDYMEQPQLQFNYRYLIIIEEERGLRYATTLYKLENYPSFIPSSITEQNIDNNGDGRPDEINLSIHIPHNISIPSSLSIFIFFNLHIDYHDIINTESILYHRVPLSTIHSIHISSPLTIHLLSPLSSSYNQKSIHLNETDPTRMRQFPRDLMQMIANRQIGLQLERPIITPTVTSTPFTLRLSLSIPQSRIFYRTQFFELIKFAWIQYLSIFIIINWITRKISEYVYENRIMNTVIYRMD